MLLSVLVGTELRKEGVSGGSWPRLQWSSAGETQCMQSEGVVARRRLAKSCGNGCL